MMKTRLSHAEEILYELGVTEPTEINLEAIAFHMGVKVRYRPLSGCEARILANGNKAIATINSRSRPERQRFSIAHELGHWRYDRGKGITCLAKDIYGVGSASTAREVNANRFASELILPSYLCRPRLWKISQMTWKLVDELAGEFGASRLATAIRIIDLNIVPAMLVCHRADGRAWFKRSRDIPDRWFPQDQLDAESGAMDCLFGGLKSTSQVQLSASCWFDRSEAQHYDLAEESVVGFGKEVLTILTFQDEMLDDI